MYLYVKTNRNLPHAINLQHMSSFCNENCLKQVADGKLQCKCGEDFDCFQWTWYHDETVTNTILTNGNRDVLFHPIYSSGTAAIRGDTPFQPNKHYYWEIRMISSLYGTDVMVGVGTSKVDLADRRYSFCSRLGIEAQSWGYSYHGNIQHNKLVRKYGSKFGFGSIVGVHLDMYNGTLEYYLNRKPLGIAFDGLKGHELYPMACSTAAQSSIRVTCAISAETSLQFKCLKYIIKCPKLYRQYRNIPGLTRQLDHKYFWIVPNKDLGKEKEIRAKLEDSLMCPMKFKRKTVSGIRYFEPDLDCTLYDSDLELGISDNSNSSSTKTDLDIYGELDEAKKVGDGPSTSRDCDENCVKKLRRDSLKLTNE